MNEELSPLEQELAKIIEEEKKEIGDEPKEEEVVEAEEEPAQQEEQKEEPKPESAKIEEYKPEPKDWYNLREEKRKREALERELAELKQPKVAIPTADEDIEGHLQGELNQVKETLNNVLGVVGQDLLEKKEERELQSAFNVLGQYEKRLTGEKPDYESARNHLAKIYAEEYKLKNPNLSEKQLIQAVAKEIINVADYAAANNQDPAVFIYDRASLYGYRPEPKPEPKQDVKKQPDLSRVSANKEKSAGMAAGAGSGATHSLTFESLERMSNEERAKLSDTDWKRLEA